MEVETATPASELDNPATPMAADAIVEEGTTPKNDRKRSLSPTAAPPAPIEASPSIEEQAAKKRKLAIIADESKKRGKRMFGLLQNTLAQAKKQTVPNSEAAKKRRELEERLQDKLKTERDDGEEKSRRARETKGFRLEVVKKEEEIGTAESLYRTRHSMKLSLAGFLCTSFTPPAPLPSTDDIPAPFLPRLPHAVQLSDPRPSARPLYFLPYKLLPSQEDRIEDQIADVKKAIRKEKEDWSDLKEGKVDDLEKARRKRDEGLEEIERGEREERQRRRREAEEREEREGKAKGKDKEKEVGRGRGRSRSISRKPSRSRSHSPSRSRSGSRGRSADMDRRDSRDDREEESLRSIKDSAGLDSKGAEEMDELEY